MAKKVSELLACAKDQLTEETWLKGELGLLPVPENYDYRMGDDLHLQDPTSKVEAKKFFASAVMYCAVGALYKCQWWDEETPEVFGSAGPIQQCVEVLNRVSVKKHGLPIVELNDKEETELEDVLGVYIEGIELAKQEGV